MKTWLVEFDEQELCGWPRQCVELVLDVGPLLSNLLFTYCFVIWFQNV